MKTEEILSKILLPDSPDWSVSGVIVNETNSTIRVSLDYIAKDINIGGVSYPIFDFRSARDWRHLDLWQYKTYLSAKVPRYKVDGKVITVPVPWADSLERMSDLLKKKF